jgi:hypothetical protein
LDNIAFYLGMSVKRTELSGPNGGPLEVVPAGLTHFYGGNDAGGE